MDKSKWIQIQLQGPSQIRELAIARLWMLGCEGVHEGILDGQPVAWAFLPASLEESARNLLGEKDYSSLSVGFAPLPDVDWNRNFRQLFKPAPLSQKLFLVPAWSQESEEMPKIPSGMIPIVMEAGQAFGTGLHESTRLVLGFLESILEGYSPVMDWEVLDVGTGTGILAIAARKLGVERVFAMDNDPISIEVASENFEKNGVVRVDLRCGELSSWRGEYRVVLANILLETHRLLLPDYVRLLADEGTLVLAGLVMGQLDEVQAQASQLGLRLVERRALGDWESGLFRRS